MGIPPHCVAVPVVENPLLRVSYLLIPLLSCSLLPAPCFTALFW
jgi:hypothetical protein